MKRLCMLTGCALTACLHAGPARAQVTVHIPIAAAGTTSMFYQLGARTSGSTFASYLGSVTLRIGPGQAVTVLDVHVSAANWSGSVPYAPFPSVPCSVTNFSLAHATPNAGVPVVAFENIPGRLEFSDQSVPVLLTGVASHNATGGACSNLTTQGIPCAGAFDYATFGIRTYIVEGVVPASGTGPAEIHVRGSVPHDPAQPGWGMVGTFVGWTPTLSANTCIADFNASGSVSVQDIFDFLAAWFSGDPRADVSGGGLGVQDIFDFLALWFTGCA